MGSSSNERKSDGGDLLMGVCTVLVGSSKQWEGVIVIKMMMAAAFAGFALPMGFRSASLT